MHKKLLSLLIFFLFSADFFAATYYVATDGSDNNDGSSSSPFAAIQKGIDVASNGDTVLVAAGTYVENINYNGKNIVVGSLYLTTSDTSYISSTIIDGNQSGSVVTFESGEGSTALLSGFTIKNGTGVVSEDIPFYDAPPTTFGGGIFIRDASPKFSYLKIEYNNAESGGGIVAYNSNSSFNQLDVSHNNLNQPHIPGGGGGLLLINCNANIKNTIIANNYTRGDYGGAGILFFNSTCIVENVSIINNECGSYGGGVSLIWLSDVSFINVIIANNIGDGAIHADNSAISIENCTIAGNNMHGISLNGYSNVTIESSIIWDNSGDQIYYHWGNSENNPVITFVNYSNIEGGYQVYIDDITGFIFGPGNINSNPFFIDASNGDYHLQSNSPCINTGDPDTDGDGITWVNDTDDQDPDGTRKDMGAYPYSLDIQPVNSIEITSPGYRLFSSPVSGTIYGDLLEELWTQGASGSDQPNNASPNIWTYNSGWNAITDLDNTALMAGQGMVVYVFADTDFDGNDDLPVTLTVNGVLNEPGVTITTDPNEWTLLGNPYGLAVSVNQLLVDNPDFNSTVYIWDNDVTAYKTHNGQVGDLLEGLISPFDGFWIQAGTIGNSFVFNQESIVNSYGTAGRSTTFDSTGSAVFTFNSGEYSSSVYLSFNLQGQINLDPADASRLLPMSSMEHLTSMIHESGKSLSINNLPFDLSTDISMDMDVMMLFPIDGGYATQEQDVTMTWDLSNLPEGMVLSMIDNTSGQSIDLSATETANITLPNKGILSLESSGFMGTYPELDESQFTLMVQATTTATDVESIPDVFTLHQAYPNPFNPSTLISYDLPQDSHVSLQIFDITGRQVKTLINDHIRAGKHQVTWNADQISSGIYLVRLVTGEKIFNQKITYLK